MSDQRRRRLRSTPAPRRVGEPNVLSNQATPNRLSTMGMPGGAGRPALDSKRPTQASKQPDTRPRLGRPAVATGRAIPQPSDEAPRRRRLPSLGTLITIAFVVLWASRVFNGFGSDSSTPTSRPVTVPTTSGAPGSATDYGVVTFGKALGDDCALESRATSFAPGTEVWWRADLLRVQAASAAIVVVTFKDSRQIDYEYVPPDPDFGSWQVFCSGPAEDALGGTYRIELWNGERSKLLAKGEFVRTGPSATAAATGAPGPSASPSTPGSPSPTFVTALAGDVAFGTALAAGCVLGGIADTFEQDDLVWWRAALNQDVPVGVEVRLFAMLNGTVITDEAVPASALRDARSVVCAWAPTEGVATGYYAVQVWSSDRQVMLATGTFFRNP